MQLDLVDLFDQYFEILPADDPYLKKESFILRHQIYCQETGFESEDDCKIEVDQRGRITYLEVDKYDDRSAHYLIRHRRTGKFAATVRLILPIAENLESRFPIEVNASLNNPVTDPTIRARLAEISRFSVSKDFKRRKGEAGTLAGITRDTVIYFESDERRVLPHITVSLIAATFRMAWQHGITHWYAVMEPPLLRLLNRFGIAFVPIGPDVEYHGMRRPCIGIVDDILGGIQEKSPDVWDLITQRGQLSRSKSSHKRYGSPQANVDAVS